jgi:NaMN:DMB phosphoribosyltransferase
VTPDQFAALARLMRLRRSAAAEGLRLVLVDGLTQNAAAAASGAPQPNIARLVVSARRCVEWANALAGAAMPARWRQSAPADAAASAS